MITRNTGYRYRKPKWPAGAKERLDRVMKEIGDLYRASNCEDAYLPEEIVERLDKLLEHIEELQFWYDLSKDWETSIYYLSHIARGNFGKVMAEALFIRGPGRNGKDRGSVLKYVFQLVLQNII